MGSSFSGTSASDASEDASVMVVNIESNSYEKSTQAVVVYKDSKSFIQIMW